MGTGEWGRGLGGVGTDPNSAPQRLKNLQPLNLTRALAMAGVRASICAHAEGTTTQTVRL